MPKQKSTDPLDIMMAVLAVIILLTALSWYIGYGIYVTTFVIVLFTYGYFKAPSRFYPTAAAIAESSDLTGKVAIVTGATSGIGVDTARVLALHGAHVYIAARNEQKMRDTETQLRKVLPQGAKLSLLKCDLGDLDSVKACAAEFLKQESKLHLLINNAGIMSLPERTPTKQNLESQVGVCHVGHFYLTQLLMPALQAAGTADVPSRVVALSSVAFRYHEIPQLLKSSKLETEPYHPQVGYGNAKASNMLFAYELHKRYYASKHVAAFSVMPGGIFTGLQGHVKPWTMFKWTVVAPFFFKSIEQGAATTMVCALTADPAADGGQYFDNCKSTTTVDKVLEECGGAEVDTPGHLWTATEALLKELGY